jgi:hypothetical protein
VLERAYFIIPSICSYLTEVNADVCWRKLTYTDVCAYFIIPSIWSYLTEVNLKVACVTTALLVQKYK